MKKRLIAAGVTTLIAAVVCGILLAAVQLHRQLETARALKRDLQALASAVVDRDIESAEDSLQRIEDGQAALQEALDSPVWKSAAQIPSIETQVDDAKALLEILERTTENTLRPLLTVVKDSPALSDSEKLQTVMAILRDTFPQLKQDVQTLNRMSLAPLDSSGKMRSGIQVCNQLLELPGLDAAFFGQAAELLGKYPIDSLTTQEGFYLPAVSAYLAFAEYALPIAEMLPDVLESEPLKQFSESRDFGSWLKILKDLTALYRQNPEIIQLIHSVIDGDADKCFLLAALNPSELRACGGFPAFVSIISSRSGSLRIGGFNNINYILPRYTPYEAQITEDEHTLFLRSMTIPWDASFCPDFERAAGIWALSFQARDGRPVDGVIGVSSVIIQKLLGILGDIPLSNGTVLTDKNATRTICYEMNFQNYRKGVLQADADEATDAIYGEMAKAAMERLRSRDILLHLPELLDIVKESFAKRTMMLWMKDETAQQIVRGLRWDGGLNTEAESPEIGVFLNCDVASKLGWFVDMDIQLGQPSQTEDNRLSYPLAVTITNTITRAEIQQATWYILGSYHGSFIGTLYIFAPDGGTVKNFHIDTEAPTRKMNYHQRDLVHAHYFPVFPGSSVTLTCNILCAPGVTKTPAIVKTPTLQEYRQQ